ncbi:hypothetical protein FD754_024946 [Muntiacus muntjak]|uniref:Solute carrier family 25 member 3 n=1 Tax=Muntiacus muntjak TaxID=9888 RepID=A0A5N3UMS5_MUNMU|nr:hypothetical protein FD754_024946 [Muntiacus muntjak]
MVNSCEGEIVPHEPGSSARDHSPHSTSHGCWNSQAYSCEYGSVKFYALCGFGGVLSCDLTHTAVADPQKYKSILNGLSVTLKEDGFRGLAKGWAPTLIGYSLQGLCKFGFYEVYKVLYSNMLGEENAITVFGCLCQC